MSQDNSEKQPLERLVKVDVKLCGRFPIAKGKDPEYTTINSQGQITLHKDLRKLYVRRQKSEDYILFAGEGEGDVVAVLKEEPNEMEYETFNPINVGNEGRFVLPFDIEPSIDKIYFQALGDRVEIREYKKL